MEEENKKTSNKNIIIIATVAILIFVVAIGGFVFITNRGTTTVQNGSETGTPQVTQGDSMSSEENSSTNVKEFNVTAKQFEFIPSTITVNEGDTVKLNITSTDVTHGFALPDFGVNETLNPNETVTVEFVADKKGTFRFFCSVVCGAGHSDMNGTLVVE